ncbi:hypothetical protein [Streptomyces sp. NPDC056634]|uniref:hypothetical protein n=1 Tax=Streptomyces sp. NPDC056634 TaxID=3345885 RepID=UPI0036C2D433
MITTTAVPVTTPPVPAFVMRLCTLIGLPAVASMRVQQTHTHSQHHQRRDQLQPSRERRDVRCA